MSSSPSRSRYLVNGSISNRADQPDGVETVCSARSMVISAPGDSSAKSIRCSTSDSLRMIGNNPILVQLL